MVFVQSAMRRFGSQVTDDHVWEMIDEADMDGDSRISYDEFVRIMGGTSSRPNAFVTAVAKRHPPQGPGHGSAAPPLRAARAEPAMSAVVAAATELGARKASTSFSSSGQATAGTHLTSSERDGLTRSAARARLRSVLRGCWSSGWRVCVAGAHR